MGRVLSRLFETFVARGTVTENCLIYKCIMYNLPFNSSIAVSFSMAVKKNKKRQKQKNVIIYHRFYAFHIRLSL